MGLNERVLKRIFPEAPRCGRPVPAGLLRTVAAVPGLRAPARRGLSRQGSCLDFCPCWQRACLSGPFANNSTALYAAGRGGAFLLRPAPHVPARYAAGPAQALPAMPRLPCAPSRPCGPAVRLAGLLPRLRGGAGCFRARAESIRKCPESARGSGSVPATLQGDGQSTRKAPVCLPARWPGAFLLRPVPEGLARPTWWPRTGLPARPCCWGFCRAGRALS